MTHRNVRHETISNGPFAEESQSEQKNSEKRYSRGWATRALCLGLGAALVFGIPGCRKSSNVSAAQTASSDPANGNFAPQSEVNESVQQAQAYQQGQAPAPVERRSPDGSYQPQYDQSYGNPQPAYDNGQPAYDNGQAQYDNGQGYYDPSQLADDEAQAVYEADLTDEQANEAPPPIPDYDQPPAPDPDYLWTPGYWAWGPYGYYWVPGAWVQAPYEGALWTPGFWVFWGGHYRFHHGFWATHIGFYGGVNYGYGYPGYGYYGGYWTGGHFCYNRAVTHIDPVRVRFVYDHPVNAPRFAGAVSYNGGPRGVRALPRPVEIAVVLHEQRRAPMQAQLHLRDEAEHNRAQFFRYNGGRPEVRSEARPITFDRREAPAALPRPEIRQGRGTEGHGFRGGNDQWQQPGENRQPSAGEVFSQGRVTRGNPGTVQQNQPAQQNQQQYRGQQPQAGQPPARGQEGWRPGYHPEQNVQPSQPQYRGTLPAQQPQQQAQPQPQFRRGNGQEIPQAQPQQQPQSGQPPARGQEGWRPGYHPEQNVQPAQPQYRGAPPAQQPQQQAQPQPQFRRGNGQEIPQAQPQQQAPQAQPQFRRGWGNEQQNRPEQARPQQQPQQQFQPRFQRGPEVQQPAPQQSAPQPQPQFRRGPEMQQARPQPQPQSQPQPQARPGPPPRQDQGRHEDDHGDHHH